MGFSGAEADGVVMESSELRSERMPLRHGGPRSMQVEDLVDNLLG
jgi:hypothetical protein